jgi:hypothetical protein
MMPDTFGFGSGGYFLMLALLLFARGMDFFSTWVATPTLALEGNPLAKKMGWKIGAIVNLALCIAFAFWPLTAIIVITAGLLVAAHNFHNAWLMRSMGEDAYRLWFMQRIARTRRPLYILCLLGETVLTGLVGAGVVCFAKIDTVPFAIGLGIVAYAVIVLFYTSLSLWRTRHRLEYTQTD